MTVKGSQAARADGHADVTDATFDVRAGESTASPALAATARRELVEILIGVPPRSPDGPLAGTASVDRLAAEALRARLVCIPADRFGYGLAGDLAVADNFGVGQMHNGNYGSGCVTPTCGDAQGDRSGSRRLRCPGRAHRARRRRCFPAATRRS